VKIADLYPANGGKPPGQKRFGVAIDRDTETAAKGLLYTYQVVEENHAFSLELWAENMSDEHWGVLGVGLLELLGGNFWIGGKTAVGLGQCRLKADTLKLEYFDNVAGLQTYLTQQKWQETLPGKKVKEFLDQRVTTLINQLVK
jgi:CRISPR/Cas system CSM-associated protein Csm3 (group 7 of RAMP superfamily)